MRLGIHTFPADGAIAPGPLAVIVEEMGFASLWFSDHTHIPVKSSSLLPSAPSRGAPDSYGRLFDLFIAMTAAGLASKHIQIGSAVCILPERDPIITAKQAASLDRLIDGRLMLGIGAGWNAEELANHGVAFSKRYQVMTDRVQAMKAIWSSDQAEFHSLTTNFDLIHCGPRPAHKGGPPVLIGGESAQSVERVIRFADGWLPRASMVPPGELSSHVRAFRNTCTARGRGKLPIVVVLSGATQHLLDVYRAADVDEVIVSIPAAGPRQTTKTLKRLAKLVRGGVVR